MAAYNRTRYVEQLLDKTEDAPPSFTVHLHAEYWILNNGSKFLYHNPIASLLDDIRAQRIPVDFLQFFDAAGVPFYEGCMIVELLDYRPQRGSEPALKNPSKTRVVLHPSPETLWADICSLNHRVGGKWTDMNSLEVESKLLLATSQPLCLDPDPHLTRVVNSVIRVSTPSMPSSLKRKASAMEPEEDGPEKVRKERLLSFMVPRDNRAHAPSYRLLDAIQTGKQKQQEAQRAAAAVPAQPMPAPAHTPQPASQPTPQSQPTPAPPTPTLPAAHSPPAQPNTKPTIARNGSRTPAPTPPTQFVVPQVPVSAGPGQPTSMHPPYAVPNRAPTPAQLAQAQPAPHPYLQHYHLQAHQPAIPQHSPPTQPPQQLPRPPSQPQRTNTPAQSHVSPQLPTQQPNIPPVPLQRFSQTPKPSQIQLSTSKTPQPNPAQQSYPTPLAQTGQPMPQMTYYRTAQAGQQPPNIQPAPQPHQHATLQQQQQLLVQHQQQQQLNAAMNNGGRTTPAQVHPNSRGHVQLQQLRAISATPSPVKGSPVVNQQQPKGTIQVQPGPSLQGHQLAIGGANVPQGQPGQPQQVGAQPIAGNPGGMQLPPQRIQFQPGYNPPHQMMGQSNPAGTHATPTMAHASPHIGSVAGRPITPALGGDVKAQQPGAPPLRGPTPTQQQHAVRLAQSQALQAKTPMMQTQQLPGSQGVAQAQRAPTPVPQPAARPNTAGPNLAQQMSIYAQRNGIPPSQMKPLWETAVRQSQTSRQPLHVVFTGLVNLFKQQQQQHQANASQIAAPPAMMQQMRQAEQHQQHIQAANLQTPNQVQDFIRQGVMRHPDMSDPRVQEIVKKQWMGQGQPAATGHPGFQQPNANLQAQQQMMGTMGPTMQQRQQHQQQLLAQAQQAAGQPQVMGLGTQPGGSGMGVQNAQFVQMQQMHDARRIAQRARAGGVGGKGAPK